MKKTILYFYISKATFVAKDISILQEKFNIIEFEFDTRKKKIIPFLFLKQLFFIIFFSFKTEIFIVQFASFHSFIPSLIALIFKKKCFIIVGGTDCVSYPSIKYGNFSKPLLSWFTKYSLKMCTKIIAVHSSLISSINNYYGIEKEQNQGILSFVKLSRSKITIVHNGYDEKIFKVDESLIRNKDFITVASGSGTLSRIKLKGIDLFIEMANIFSDKSFTLVGAKREDLITLGYDLPNNLEIISFVPNAQLPKLYSQNKYYVQLSISEGFPNALCEAMLCECVPIVSLVASMPEIIGNTGYILHNRDNEQLSILLKKILTTARNGKECRKNILNKYPVSSRKSQLIGEILNNEAN